MERYAATRGVPGRNGDAPEPGEIFVPQPDLARTLERIAAQG